MHRLSLCRPGDSKWTHVNFPFFVAGLMYSVRDQRFYLYRKTGKEEHEINGPIDLIDTSCSDFPQVSVLKSFPLSGIPNRLGQVLSPNLSTKYLVESPSGDFFVVYRYQRSYNSGKDNSAFLVFRQDPEQRIASYTEDIGDLCIFLSVGEAFCVSATEYPGLKPNSVYFVGQFGQFGFYDLSSHTFHYRNALRYINDLHYLHDFNYLDDRHPYSITGLWLAPLQ